MKTVFSANQNSRRARSKAKSFATSLKIMDRWIGKVAVVTGASAGIGAAILQKLVSEKIKVVGLARRPDLINKFRADLPEEQQDRISAYKCDVTREDDVREAFKWIQENFGGTDILVNCAGVLRSGNLVDDDSGPPIREMIETNVLGVVHCTREAFRQMKLRKVDGHVIMINSLAGHTVPEVPPQLPMFSSYSASKHALTALVESYRQEFQRLGTRVKVTSISPGAVATNIFPPELKKHWAEYPSFRLLEPDDVASAVVYALSSPPHVQIREIMMDAVQG